MLIATSTSKWLMGATQQSVSQDGIVMVFLMYRMITFFSLSAGCRWDEQHPKIVSTSARLGVIVIIP